MAKADQTISGANSLGTLGISPIQRIDRLKLSDRDDLFRFGYTGSSSVDLKLSLSQISKANFDLELYRFKRPINQVIQQIGNTAFRSISNRNRTANLQLVARSRRGGNKTETLDVNNLSTGEYLIRVLHRSGSSRYRLNLDSISTQPPADRTPPSARLTASNIAAKSRTPYEFTVTYTDNTAIDFATVDDSDIRVTGVKGYSQLARKVAVSSSGNGSPLTVTYRITAPGGSWDGADQGRYTIAMQGNQISDTRGNSIATQVLGNFDINIASSLEEILASGTNTSNVRDVQVRLNSAIDGVSISNSSFQFEGAVTTATFDLISSENLVYSINNPNLTSSRFSATTDCVLELNEFCANPTGREVKYVVSDPASTLKLTFYIRPSAPLTDEQLQTVEPLQQAIQQGISPNFITVVSGDSIVVGDQPIFIGSSTFNDVDSTDVNSPAEPIV